MAATEKDAQKVQDALVEAEVKAPGHVIKDTKEGLIAEVKGKTFRLADDLSPMAIMEWAGASDEELGSSIVSLYHMLESVIHEDDWTAFKNHARKSRLSAEHMVELTNEAIEKIAARPTKQPDTSSGTSSRTTRGSKGTSSAK